MVDTDSEMETCIDGVWRAFKYLATGSFGLIVGEVVIDGEPVIKILSENDALLRNRSARIPLTPVAMSMLVGQVLQRIDTATAIVDQFDPECDSVYLFGDYYTADELMHSDWRRLDGSGLWVEE